MPTITPCLWFDGQAEAAADLYTRVFPNSKVTATQVMSEDNPFPGPLPESRVLVVEVSLDGNPITLLNGGPLFQFTEATSLQINCTGQEEVDHYWDALSADGGAELPCGWVKDPFGFPWQVVPTELTELSSTGTPAQTDAVNRALMGMQRIIVADLQEAWKTAE